jgi:hypothetical protein
MDLFEYAIHPDAFKDFFETKTEIYRASWAYESVTTSEQFQMLNQAQYVGDRTEHINSLTDENEFRMFCLFVYYATTPEAFNQSEE